MKNDSRLIKTLEEAENERMHLMIFIEIAKPNAFERYLFCLLKQFLELLLCVVCVLSENCTQDGWLF